MAVWWDGLTIFQQVLAFLAMPATVLLVLQTVLQLIGFGHDAGPDLPGDAGDFDADTGDFDADGGDFDGTEHGTFDLDYADSYSVFSLVGLRLMTFRGIVAFLAVGGWTGLVLSETGLHPVWVAVLAAAAGAAAAYALAVVMRAVMKLQSTGNMELRNAIGQTATVYIPIPAQRDGYGKITLLLQGALTELEAVSDEEEKLPTGREVKVVDVIGQTLLVVPAMQPAVK